MVYRVLDIENVGEPHDGTLICVGLGDRAFVPDGEGWSDLLDDLADDTITKVVFTKHDHRWLRLYGIDVAGPIVDVQVMAWVVNELQDLDLASLSQTYVPHAVKRSRIKRVAGILVFECDDGSVVPLIDAPVDEVCAYNVGDLVATDALFHELRRRILFDDLGDYFENDCLPLTPVLVDMETTGIPIDIEATEELGERLEDEAAAYEHRLRSDGGLPAEFNLDSPIQLADFIYRKTFTMTHREEITPEQHTEMRAEHKATGGFPDWQGAKVTAVGTKYVTFEKTYAGLGLKTQVETDSGKKSTSAKTLRVEQEHPWIDTLLEMSSRKTIVKHLKNFEARYVASEGRVFGRFNQTGTKTGRLSASSPNLQNVPSRGDIGRQVRSLFVPPAGRIFVHGDYGQLEPRLMGHFSGDPVLLDIYDNDLDIYLETAHRIFGDVLPDGARDLCKTLVLGMGYGSGAATIRRTLAEGGTRIGLDEAEDLLATLKKVYAVLFDWKEDVIATAMNEGYVETLSGHRRRFSGRPERHQSWRAQGQDERQAVNAVIQGSAADIVARTMVGISTELPALDIIAQVHDELLLEGSGSLLVDIVPTLHAVQRIAEEGHGFDLRVPLEFVPKVVASWAQGKD